MGTKIDRRRVLVGISAAMGAALSPAAVKAFDAAKSEEQPKDFQSLGTDQQQALRAVIDTIIPQTDTASASGAGVDLYIDHMINAVLNQSEAAAVTDFLDAFSTSYPTFPTLPAQAQHEILSGIDARLQEDTPFMANYRAVKELTLVGYYTSEEGASVELEYDPVPGPFHIGPISDYSRSWST